MKDLLEEWNHFIGRLNLKDSALDARAIQFMNEFSLIVEEYFRKYFDNNSSQGGQ